MILLPLLHLNENFAWCKHWTICCRRIYFRKSCTFFATFPNPSPYTTHHHHHRREWMLHIENVYFLLPTEYRYFIPFHNNRLFAKSKYSALRNKRNDVMSLLLGIFWPEKGWRPSKRSVFIANFESAYHIKGGFEFCLLPRVSSSILEAVTQLLDIVAFIR